MAHAHCTRLDGTGNDEFLITLCTVHTTQVQGSIVFYCGHSDPCPGPGPGPVQCECVWAIKVHTSSGCRNRLLLFNLNYCKRLNLVLISGRIEVCTVLPQGFKSRKNFHVLWKKSGEAKFHTECWSRLTKSARSQGRTKKKKQKQKGSVIFQLFTPSPA